VRAGIETRTATALIVGFAVVAAIGAVVLARSPATVARTNGVLAVKALWHGPNEFCQAHETLPRGVSAIRLYAQALVGPRVKVTAVAHGRVLDTGEQEAGWAGENVTVPLAHLTSAAAGASICVKFGAPYEVRILYGDGSYTLAKNAKTGGRALPKGFRVKLEYLTPGHRSWLSLATVLARHLGLGHVWKGGWIVLLLALSMAGAVALGSWLVVRDLR
jgi:hypothetical protein